MPVATVRAGASARPAAGDESPGGISSPIDSQRPDAALRYIPSRISTTRAPRSAGDGFSVVVPGARSTIRSTTRSNDQRDVLVGQVDRDVVVASRAPTRVAARSSSTWPRSPVTRMLSWCGLPKVPRGIEAPQTVPIAPLPKRTAIASWSSTALPGEAVNAATALAPAATGRGAAPARCVSQLALAVAAAGELRVAPRLAARKRIDRRRRGTSSRLVSRSRTTVVIWTSTCSTGPSRRLRASRRGAASRCPSRSRRSTARRPAALRASASMAQASAGSG